MIAAVLALASALLFGTGIALQSRATSPHRTGATTGRRALLQTMTRPGWLVGTGLDWLGTLTHIAALRFGPLTLVQPLALSTIVIAVPAEALCHGHLPDRRQFGAAVRAAVGLMLLVVLLNGGRRGVPGQFATAWVWPLVAASIAMPLVLAERSSSARVKALLCGAGAGASFGAAAALVRGAQLAVGPHVFGIGWLAAAGAVVAGGVGVLGSQAGLHVARLSWSLPVQDFCALVVSVGIGAGAVEQHAYSVVTIVGLVLAIGLFGEGCWRLTRGTSRYEAGQQPAAARRALDAAARACPPVRAQRR